MLKLQGYFHRSKWLLYTEKLNVPSVTDISLGKYPVMVHLQGYVNNLRSNEAPIQQGLHFPSPKF